MWRGAPDGAEGGLEILVVHRPRYDDWSFPKGKLDVGETHEAAAVREVHEETGLNVELGPELSPAAYIDHLGRPKTVRYWSMTVLDGAFARNDEVDEVRWLPLLEVPRILSYRRDADVLDAFVRAVGHVHDR